MKGFELSQEQLSELHVALRAAKRGKARAAYKINALILLGTGWSLTEVSDVLFLDEDTLKRYVNLYKNNDLPSVLKTFYKGSQAKLSAKQHERLIEELDGQIFLSTKSICAFVEEEFDICYTVSGMTSYLHRHGYVYKKPKVKPAYPDIDLQEQFLAQYLHFMERKREDEAVFFMDAVHPVYNSMPSYGWIKKGKEKALLSNPGRCRLNIHGAMNSETLETTVVITEDSTDTDSTINVFKQLEKYYPQASAIYVILDNARYHYSKRVKEWLKDSKIRLIFLPPYSPELNLIERLWKVFKKNTLYNKFYETKEFFKNACFDFFKNQKKYAHEISSIMGNGLAALT